MRSIGKRNIALVKKITREEIANCTQAYHSVIGYPNYSGIEDKVIERLPESLWDTWESADSEIRRIIQNEIAEV